jgi:hypothetical protein
MNKEKLFKEHKEEFEARWRLLQIDSKIEQLQKQRQIAHADWMRAKDKTRNLRRLGVEPFEDAPDLVQKIA